MSEDKNTKKVVQSTLKTTASAELDEQVKKELEKKDPDKEKAKAILASDMEVA